MAEGANEIGECKEEKCANCGATLQGEFCHECGQSVHSVLKPVHGMLEDTLDIVFHVDGRVVHTLPPLLLRPGFLTLEYFAGRRVRYVAPFRLMFVLCLLAFFFSHLAIDNSKSDGGGSLVTFNLHDDADSDFKDAHTAAAVDKTLRQQLADLKRARQFVFTADATKRFRQAEDDLRQAAARRLVALGAAPAGSASVPAAAAASSIDLRDPTDQRDVVFDEAFQHIDSVDVPWLPGFVNARLSRAAAHLRANWQAVQHGGQEGQEAQERITAGIFGALPLSMFVMLPFFALLLKLFYVFRRRLYMEHLIVALHSHAFLFLDVLLLVLLAMLSGWLVPHAGWTAYPLTALEWVLALWAPVYLLWMQKRIYRQGWAMTLLKFWCIGWFYAWLLLIAVSVAFVLGITH